MNQNLERLKQTDTSPEYYQYYPRLFYAYFPNIEESKIKDISDAGYFYYQSVLIADSIHDNMDLYKIPHMFFLQEETIKILTSIYGRNSEFWQFWELRKNEYFQAFEVEKNLNDENITWDIYQDLADKKSAFGKIAIDSLFFLSDKRIQLYETLLKSHALFSVGFQLYDDVKDFKEDLMRNQFNWAVHELKKQLDFSVYDLSALNKYLFIKGTGQQLLNKSIMYFDKAIEILKPYKIDSEWSDIIQETRRTISLYLDNTEGYLQTLIKKMELKKQNNASYFLEYDHISDLSSKKGLKFIHYDFSHNYAELNHIMFLSKQADGFENTEQVHYSDTFQRALLNDCLVDVAKKHRIDFEHFAKQEVEYYLKRMSDDIVGGWSYFPTVKEIAADIDDLGQIMQLFIKNGFIDLVDVHCKVPIQIALENKYNKNGGISTWLIPVSNRTELHEKQIFFNETKWGAGPDPEVVANFMYALHLYSPETYREYIQNAIRYIIKQQQEDGYWNSRWYYGSLYGTYVCLRLLREYKEYDIAIMSIELALTYLKIIQNEDGGFGLYKDAPSDPLSTALAVLTLKLFKDKPEPDIKRAETFLLENQHEDGSWKAIEFIKPKVNEPYKSRTLTTAYVLQALNL